MNKNKTQFPVITSDLLEEMDRLFPERSPDFKWSDKECLEMTVNLLTITYN